VRRLPGMPEAAITLRANHVLDNGLPSLGGREDGKA
jgi:hypothetical protein